MHADLLTYRASTPLTCASRGNRKVDFQYGLQGSRNEVTVRWKKKEKEKKRKKKKDKNEQVTFVGVM